MATLALPLEARRTRPAVSPPSATTGRPTRIIPVAEGGGCWPDKLRPCARRATRRRRTPAPAPPSRGRTPPRRRRARGTCGRSSRCRRRAAAAVMSISPPSAAPAAADVMSSHVPVFPPSERAPARGRTAVRRLAPRPPSLCSGHALDSRRSPRRIHRLCSPVAHRRPHSRSRTAASGLPEAPAPDLPEDRGCARPQQASPVKQSPCRAARADTGARPSSRSRRPGRHEVRARVGSRSVTISLDSRRSAPGASLVCQPPWTPSPWRASPSISARSYNEAHPHDEPIKPNRLRLSSDADRRLVDFKSPVGAAVKDGSAYTFSEQDLNDQQAPPQEQTPPPLPPRLLPFPRRCRVRRNVARVRASPETIAGPVGRVPLRRGSGRREARALADAAVRVRCAPARSCRAARRRWSTTRRAAGPATAGRRDAAAAPASTRPTS